MAVTAKLFASLVSAAFNKEIDLLDDTIKVMLSTVTYVPDQDVHNYKDDVTNEVTGTGYTAGGATLASDTLTYTSGSNLWTYDAADVTWTTLTATGIRIATIYDDTPGTAATKPLIEYQDLGGDQTVSGANFTLQWNASGIFTFTIG